MLNLVAGLCLAAKSQRQGCETLSGGMYKYFYMFFPGLKAFCLKRAILAHFKIISCQHTNMGSKPSRSKGFLTEGLLYLVRLAAKAPSPEIKCILKHYYNAKPYGRCTWIGWPARNMLFSQLTTSLLSESSGLARGTGGTGSIYLTPCKLYEA